MVRELLLRQKQFDGTKKIVNVLKDNPLLGLISPTNFGEYRFYSTSPINWTLTVSCNMSDEQPLSQQNDETITQNPQLNAQNRNLHK